MWLGSKVVKSSKNIFKPHLKSSIWIKNLGAKLYNKISTSLTNTSSTNTNLNFKNKHAHALDAPLCFDDAHDDVNYMLNQGKYHIQSAMLVQSCNQAIWSTQFIFNGGLIGCYFTFKLCWKVSTITTALLRTENLVQKTITTALLAALLYLPWYLPKGSQDS